ncbi:MAG: hypothetical protein U0K83_07570 [Bacteroidales bacterium]|jgi:hypothetical protein|nr:hypothetical protein [Bacteroidales bacterium]MEE1098171.1 hypothetical protein [Bacteroidales bacterium]
MRKQAKKLLLAIALLSSWQAYSQVTPHTTTDYHLEGYPKQVRYMKFESDSALKNQRTSFIEDYQLTFNDQRQLIERTNYINGKKDRYSTYEYDNNRQLFKETLLEANNKIVSVTEYTYNYLGRIAEITTIEYPQSRGGANTVVRHESYEYNKKGQQIKHIISSDNSKESRTTQFFYGPQDSLIYTITTYSYNKNVDKVTYKRDFKHSLIEKINIRNDKQTRRETYSYNDKGLLEQKEVYNGKNKKLLTYTYKYDQHNYMIEEIAVNDKDVRTIEYYYKYEKDKFFNWTKRTVYDIWDVKYTEIRKIEYEDKEHWYEEMKDADTKRVVRDIYE